MRSVSLLEFRKNAAAVLGRARKGERMLLTYRGKAVMRLEPIVDKAVDQHDPFYRLAELSIEGGTAMSNKEMDAAIYGI